MIAVLGARGKTGRAVVSALRARGAEVRGFVRRDPGPGEVAVDLLEPATVEAALTGVSAVYHLAPNVHPDEVRIGEVVIAAAKATGVRRLVFHSVLHPHLHAMPHHWAKLQVEERVALSGLDWTVLRPGAYVQNFTGHSGGPLRLPYDPEARFSLVDLADVAEVAARVVTEDGHGTATYELAGPRPVSGREVAGALEVEVEREPVGSWAARSDLPAYARDALTAMFAHYDRHGLVGNPRVLRVLLGRQPADPLEVLRRSEQVGVEGDI